MSSQKGSDDVHVSMTSLNVEATPAWIIIVGENTVGGLPQRDYQNSVTQSLLRSSTSIRRSYLSFPCGLQCISLIRSQMATSCVHWVFLSAPDSTQVSRGMRRCGGVDSIPCGYRCEVVHVSRSFGITKATRFRGERLSNRARKCGRHVFDCSWGRKAPAIVVGL